MGIVVADFNNDRRLDIVTTNCGHSTISILLGCGNSSFVNRTTYETGISPLYVTVSDLNNDTKNIFFCHKRGR